MNLSEKEHMFELLLHKSLKSNQTSVDTINDVDINRNLSKFLQFLSTYYRKFYNLLIKVWLYGKFKSEHAFIMLTMRPLIRTLILYR